MRAKALLFWAVITLCCALLCTGKDAQRDKTSGHLGQVRQPRGALEHLKQMDEEGFVPMSDEPAEVVEVEQAKPKKKKTPEEIEAGKLLSGLIWNGTNTIDATVFISLKRNVSLAYIFPWLLISPCLQPKTDT